MINREQAQALDQADPLREFADRFVVTDPNLIYLDGNSLGRQPRTAAGLVTAAMDRWADELVGAWRSKWIDLPRQVGAALAPLVSRPGVSVREVSRLLAAAAPDRFFSILGETLQLRLSSIVGFDLTVRASELQDQLTRYIDAVELTREFPWAVATSAERTSDHPREPDAWSKRVALLGCLIC